MYYVYIVQCSDDSLYTGYTNDLFRRINTHNSGKGAKYTRGRIPVVLVFSLEFTDKLQALRKERSIKKLSRTNKLKLINDYNKVRGE